MEHKFKMGDILVYIKYNIADRQVSDIIDDNYELTHLNKNGISYLSREYVEASYRLLTPLEKVMK